MRVKGYLIRMKLKPAVLVVISSLSNIFLVTKPDVTFRKILNLKQLNNFLPNELFKMEGLGVALDII